MFSFFANIFGYLLNALYECVQNYGLAILFFSVIIKIVMLPISIKQQKSMKKSAKLQLKMKEIQDKYSNNPEKMNQEIMDLYKREKMSPFSGCFSGIVQIILLLSVFYLVRSPLTYMKKVEPQIIENYTTEVVGEGKTTNYPEIEIIRQKGQEDEAVRINMEFLGLDLSQVPTQNPSDFRVYIIPALYVISSFISMRITTAMQSGKKKKDSTEIVEKEKKEETNEMDAIMQANKSMTWFMPIMAISIAIIAPLGLALYWLVNNLLMIVERIILNKYIQDKEEEENV